MSQAPANAKICAICGQDCSNRPRTKDPRGRYTYNDCLLNAKLARGGEVVLPPLPSSDRAHSALDEPVSLLDDPASEFPPEDDGIVPLAEDDSPPPPRPSMPCPNCARPLAPDVVVCMGCGYNRATGERVGTDADGKPRGKNKGKKSGGGAKALTCAQCGYNLSGLKTTRCPECGKINIVRTSKREREMEESQRQAKLAFIKPACMLVGGLAATTLILVMQSSGAAIPGYLIAFAIGFVVSLVVYFVCSVIFIGFDEPFPLTALRLAGVYAVTDALSTLMAPLPIGWVAGWLIVGIVWIGLMVAVMEIDTEDAVIFGVISLVAKIAIGLALAALL